jgi:hypothetical protein
MEAPGRLATSAETTCGEVRAEVDVTEYLHTLGPVQLFACLFAKLARNLEPKRDWMQRSPMRRIFLAASLLLAACSAEPDATEPANSCAGKLHPSYNAKVLDQCVDVCIKCDHGTTATCSMSCTLKGAR